MFLLCIYFLLGIDLLNWSSSSMSLVLSSTLGALRLILSAVSWLRVILLILYHCWPDCHQMIICKWSDTKCSCVSLLSEKLHSPSLNIFVSVLHFCSSFVHISSVNSWKFSGEWAFASFCRGAIISLDLQKEESRVWYFVWERCQWMNKLVARIFWGDTAYSSISYQLNFQGQEISFSRC